MHYKFSLIYSSERFRLLSTSVGQTSDFLSENNKLFIRKQSDFRSETIRIAVENSIQRRYKHLTIGS